MGQRPPRLQRLLLATLVAVAASPIFALVQPDKAGSVGEKIFTDQIAIFNVFEPATALQGATAVSFGAQLESLGVDPALAHLDLRTGRWGTLMPATPLLPGTGVGNDLTWQGLGAAAPGSEADLKQVAWDAMVSYLEAHRRTLGIDVAELAQNKVTVHDDGDLIQIYSGRAVAGVPVRDSYLTAVINHGNLILMGTRNWGNVNVSTLPAKDVDISRDSVSAFVHPWVEAGFWGKPELVLVPVQRGADLARVQVGQGLDHRLAWVIKPKFDGELAQYEALVDAQTGEVFAFQDTNHYATARNVTGGVLPVSNDGVAPDGVEQAGWPMPHADVTVGADTFFTDAGGNLLSCVDGTITSTLSGQFMRMSDQCGAITESTAGNTLNFGTSAATDCSVPPGGSLGNTRASRSGFYEIGRIKELARGELPNNTWLQGQLLSTMNIPQTCNANWNGSGVNFYRSGGGCNNTGELAGVFDHEWGHGMDNNDAVPSVSSPGEGIADIYAAIRLNTSCIGRNFRGTPCGGYGDPCLTCTGVRDINYFGRTSGVPHTVAFIDAACGSGGGTPCGGSTHCEGAVYAEATWDLFNTGRPAGVGFRTAPYSYDLNRALALTTYLVFRGASGVGSWFQCATGGTGGCNANGGYLNYLAADDDNGNLADGTPHMVGIFNAFAAHQISCNAPAAVDSGCAGTPTTAPTVTGSAIDRGARLTWPAVSGATEYEIYRTDGVFGCDFGKTKVGETTGLEFVDSGLQNGRQYFYSVAAKGPNGSCFGPMSSCTTVTPAAGANLSLVARSNPLIITGGDSDAFLDNCENGALSFDVVSLGTGSQTNVRILAIDPVSHPTTVINNTLPQVISASLASCATAVGTINFQADGLSFNDTLEFEVTVTSDELFPITKTGTFRVNGTESSLQNFATRTFNFETDLEGWTVTEGTYSRTGTGGGNGTTFFADSSDALDNACDTIRSPLIRLNATSTLSLWNNFDIEPFSAGTWYDRANVGIIDADGDRTLVTPSSGRLYNAVTGGPGNYTGCNDPEAGWAGPAATWASSSWTATALQSATFAGQFVQLEVIYGTDGALALRGFWFDEVTLTNIDLQVADSQSDTCTPLTSIFADGFESGNTSEWSNAVP